MPGIAMRLGAFLLIVLLGLTTIAVSAQQEFQLRVDVSLISVDVGVYDHKGNAVTTLSKEDFLIFEDGQRVDIRAFEPSGVAFNALLVVDRSSSMSPIWDEILGGLKRFMEVLRLQDRVAIAAFDSRIDIAMDWRDAHIGRKGEIGIVPEGTGTDFYGAVAWAAGYIEGEKGRKGVIVFSDGVQAGGFASGFKTDLKKATDRVHQANVPFYFVGYNTTSQSAAVLRQLAEASGGRAFFPLKSEEMVRIYQQIGIDLVRAYSISYAPMKAPDGKFRKIEVRPLDVRLHVSQSREGYYAR